MAGLGLLFCLRIDHLEASVTRQRIQWVPTYLFVAFIQELYKEAGLVIPEDFYPELEAPRLARHFRAQGLGIKLEEE